MRIEQLKYFTRIVECGSFNQAAHELFLTQPAVTSAIKAMEAEVGSPLLMRRKKGVVPTPLGERVYNDSKRLLRDFDQALEEWKSAGTDALVRVAAIPTICAFIADYLLPSFMEQHPAINLVLEECNLMRFDDYLDGSSRRLLFTAIPINDESRQLAVWQKKGYEAKQLLDDCYTLVLGAGHPLANRPYLDKAACQTINYCNYCSFASKKPASRAPLDLFLQSIDKKADIFLSSRETITTQLLANRHAIILLEKMMRFHRAVIAGQLVLKPYSPGPLMPSRHYLVHLPVSLLTGQEQAFLEFARAHYALKFA